MVSQAVQFHFTLSFNGVYKEYPQCPKENQPPPFSLSTPMVKSVVITKLVGNIKPTHVMIVAVVNI